MKTIFATGKILLLVVFISTCGLLNAQTNETEQYRINVVRDNNGQKEVIDRTFATKVEMDAFIKENNLSLPDEKASTSKWSNDKKEKKIVVVERDGNQSENTELNVAYSNFTADERAKLIQQLLENKGCKVEVRHTTETTAYNSGETAANQIPVPASVSNVSGVTNLQLYPNPNKGEFHITFNTEKPSDVKLRITDMNGKEVYSDKVKNNTGNFNKDIYIRPAVSEGTYILEAESNGEKVTTQVVVQ